MLIAEHVKSSGRRITKNAFGLALLNANASLVELVYSVLGFDNFCYCNALAPKHIEPSLSGSLAPVALEFKSSVVDLLLENFNNEFKRRRADAKLILENRFV
jgi:hypothetical protein